MGTWFRDHILGPDTTANRPDPADTPINALYQNSDTGELEINRGPDDGGWETYRASVDTSGFALLASPTFTGDPKAPTPAPGDNDTSIATTAFVKAAIDALIAGAPGALDTLDELAAALGDDASYAASITTALGLKAPLASPALTGNPTAPTPSSGDNDTSVATTAFVQDALAKQAEVLVYALGDESTAISTGAAKLTVRAPFAMTVLAVRASLVVASSSGDPTFDINEAGSSILGSNKLSIDASEKTSVTAATATSITDPNIADDAELTFDIDVAGTGAKGPKIALYVVRA